jgi:hypothetical protein
VGEGGGARRQLGTDGAIVFSLLGNRKPNSIKSLQASINPKMPRRHHANKRATPFVHDHLPAYITMPWQPCYSKKEKEIKAKNAGQAGLKIRRCRTFTRAGVSLIQEHHLIFVAGCLSREGRLSFH